MAERKEVIEDQRNEMKFTILPDAKGVCNGKKWHGMVICEKEIRHGSDPFEDFFVDKVVRSRFSKFPFKLRFASDRLGCIPTYYKAVARCYEGDKFDSDYGMKVARNQVLCKYYNSYVKMLYRIQDEINYLSDKFDEEICKSEDFLMKLEDDKF